MKLTSSDVKGNAFVDMEAVEVRDEMKMTDSEHDINKKENVNEVKNVKKTVTDYRENVKESDNACIKIMTKLTDDEHNVKGNYDKA